MDWLWLTFAFASGTALGASMVMRAIRHCAETGTPFDLSTGKHRIISEREYEELLGAETRYAEGGDDGDV